MRKFYGFSFILLLLLIIQWGCTGEDSPVGPEGNTFLQTSLGFMVYPNGYQVDLDLIDHLFLEFNECLLGLGIGPSAAIPANVTIICTDTPFPCDSSPSNMCNGSYRNGVIKTDPAFLVLSHEFAHHELDLRTGDPDTAHDDPIFQTCGTSYSDW